MDATSIFRSLFSGLHLLSRAACFLGGDLCSAGRLGKLFPTEGRRAVAGLCLAAAFLADPAGARDFTERHYADALAKATAGETEVRMADGSRCDVLTGTHAVEVEFADKWAESVGQALLYSALTGKPGAVALIMESPSDRRFAKRLQRVIGTHDLPLVVIQLRPAAGGRVVIERPWLVAGPDLRVPNEDLGKAVPR